MSALAAAPELRTIEHVGRRRRIDRRRAARFQLASGGVVAAYLQDVAGVRPTSAAPSRRSAAGSARR